MVAARVARRLHAPDLVVVYEAGVVEDQITPELSTSPSDLRAAARSAFCGSSLDALYGQLGRGRVNRTVLEAPIVDRRGNVNTSVVGSYDQPKVRLPGSGGGTELGAFGRGLTLLSASSEARSFPEHVDYITSPGYLHAPGERRRLGYPSGRGPKVLITPLGRFTIGDVSGVEPEALHPGVTWDQMRSTCTWLPAQASVDIRELPAPTPAELEVVRGVLRDARQTAYRLPAGVQI
jgi:glutaconate CoA-transferase, subunit B